MAAARRKCADALRAATVAALLALVLQGCCRSAEHHEVRCSEACRATLYCGCGELYFVWTGCNEEHWRRTEVDLACVDIFDALRYGERILCAAASRRPAVASESLLDGPAVDAYAFVAGRLQSATGGADELVADAAPPTVEASDRAAVSARSLPPPVSSCARMGSSAGGTCSAKAHCAAGLRP
eukprot:CAMPEP_0176256770 /NCGR_PEP_ID=MMETSP0121_2-20121125/37711_1 /TAXON_ID=160619 /ORGANISM="Kryptoperidinium foliaceum, Strain CCMP 1326" /LENGTH=182 /DNA_ID=CAMNT_0017596605 /DNA_START=38 /DNA_END=584 /DNA_ORIENTATION=+